MTNRIIDADALLECVNSLYTRCQSPNKGDYSLFMISRDPELSNIFMNCLDVLVREIKELITTVPESQTQESIKDADGWCHDISKIPMGVKILVSINGNLVKAKFFSSFENIDKNTLKSIKKWRLPLNTKGGLDD